MDMLARDRVTKGAVNANDLYIRRNKTGPSTSDIRESEVNKCGGVALRLCV